MRSFPLHEPGPSYRVRAAGRTYGGRWGHRLARDTLPLLGLRRPQPRVGLLGVLLHARLHSQAPTPIRTAASVKMIGQSRKGRNATLKPVNRDTSASARSVVIATA